MHITIYEQTKYPVYNWDRGERESRKYLFLVAFPDKRSTNKFFRGINGAGMESQQMAEQDEVGDITTSSPFASSSNEAHEQKEIENNSLTRSIQSVCAMNSDELICKHFR